MLSDENGDGDSEIFLNSSRKSEANGGSLADPLLLIN